MTSVEDILNYQTIGKCENLVIVRNKYTGQNVRVNCGKCRTCLLNKASANSRLCTLEELSHRFCYFVTLTYSDQFLPKMAVKLVPGSDIDVFGYPSDNGKFNLIPISVNESTEDVCEDILGTVFYSKTKLHALLQKTALGGFVGYLRYRDIQLFIKRFRKYVSRYSSAQVRYYLCGEYGPKTFRPHWHILFYFDCPKISSVFGQAIRSCWKFGRTDYSLSRSAAGSYVAGYVNSNACTPELLKVRSIRPRALHSFRFGFASFEKDKKEIYKDPFAYFDKKVFSVNGSYVSFKLFNRLRCFLFPRCRHFDRSTNIQRLQIYLLSKRFRECFPSCPDHQRINFISSILLCSDEQWLALKEYQRYFFEMLLSLCDNRGNLFTDEKYRKNFIYSVLHTSDHFINYVCDGNPDLFETRCTMISDFYNQSRKYQLRDWYIALQEFSDRYPDNDMSVYYDNYELLYSDEDREFCEAARSNPLYMDLLYRNYCNYDKSIKHKQLNDLNKIFM